MGGPGLWIARETGARLSGVDFSRVAVAQAQSAGESLGLAVDARLLRRELRGDRPRNRLDGRRDDRRRPPVRAGQDAPRSGSSPASSVPGGRGSPSSPSSSIPNASAASPLSATTPSTTTAPSSRTPASRCCRTNRRRAGTSASSPPTAPSSKRRKPCVRKWASSYRCHVKRDDADPGPRHLQRPRIRRRGAQATLR